MPDTDTVFDNYRKLRQQISNQRLPNAITELTLSIETEAINRAPVAVGTLVNSAFIDTQKNSIGGWTGFVGFAVKYAFYVHEMPGTLVGKGYARHPKTLGYVWDGVGGDQAEPRFLEKAADYIFQSGIAQKILEDNLE